MSDFELDGQDAPQPTQRNERPRGGERDRPQEDLPTGGFRLSGLATQQYRTSVGGQSNVALDTIVAIFDSAKEHENANIPTALRRDRFKLYPLVATGVANPALMITLPAADGKGLLAYILVIEQPGAIQTRPLKDGREDYESLILPEDQLNSRFQERIGQILGDKKATFIGSQVILAETTALLNVKLDEKDHATRSRVAAILNNAIDALSGYYERQVASLNGSPITSSSLTPASVDGDGRMEVKFDYPVEQQYDTSGLPIRADVAAKTFYTTRSADELGDPIVQQDHLGTTSAALDLYYHDEGYQQTSAFGRGRGRQVDAQSPYWQAVLDITAVCSQPGVPYNLEMAQYLIANIAAQTNDHLWVRALRPRPVTHAAGIVTSIVDLGVLTMLNPNEAGRGYTNDITHNTNDDQFLEYLGDAVHPDVSVGITIQSSGEKSTVLSLAEMIANTPNNKERAKYTNMLYTAANIATGGQFLAVAERNGILDETYSPFITTGARELVGTWTDDNGTLRAASEWNVPAFLTAIKNNPDAVSIAMDYQLTYETTRSGRSWDYNLSQRFEMLRRYRVCPSIRPVATAEKLIIDARYLATLSEAFGKCALAPYYNNADRLTRRQKAGSTVYGNYAASDTGHRGKQDTRQTGGRNRSAFRTGGLY